MSSDELSLSWADHHNTLVEVFGKLLETSSLVDCTIAADGQYIKAHKIILSACSPYFELLFNQENEKNPIVVLKDVKFQELKAIIDFIYFGKVRIPEDCLGDFVDAAESLQIKGLGGDNCETPSSGRFNERRESRHAPKRGCSPVPRKRRRSLSINEENVSEISSEINVKEEYQNSESVPQGQMPVERLGRQIGQLSSSASLSNRLCSLSMTVHSSERIVETDKSIASFAEPSSSPPPPPEILSNLDSMVIKTEPEPIAEVVLPEMDFEPKGEVDVEDTLILDSEGDISGDGFNVDTQSSSIQYSAFPTALQTAAATSDNAFHGSDEAEDTSTQGAVATSLRSGMHPLPAAMTTETMLPAGQALNVFSASPLRPSPTTASAVPGSITPVSMATLRGVAARTSGKAGEERPRPHGCHVCGVAFYKPSELATHMRGHTGERPFKCNHCGMAFRQLGHLQSHLRIHTGDRPFKCDHCGKTFKQSSVLKSHQRMHSDERPYRCDECGLTTKYISVLHKHKRTFHGAPSPKRRVSHN